MNLLTALAEFRSPPLDRALGEDGYLRFTTPLPSHRSSCFPALNRLAQVPSVKSWSTGGAQLVSYCVASYSNQVGNPELLASGVIEDVSPEAPLVPLALLAVTVQV